VALQRSTFAKSRARKAIERALAEQSVSSLSTALLGYIADRTNVPAAGLTPSDGVNALARPAPPELIQEVDAFLRELEFARYSGKGGVQIEEAASKARDIIDALEGVELR
ncbi:MAG TPA: hypothetical protein VNT79_19260, partial [Phycisphaerae bacterium]|nr:hypothetical protein [Phycisphaerae bacterium]